MRALRKSALLWAFCVLPLGCTSTGSEDAGADPALSSLALIGLERSVNGDAEGASLSASAKVARFRGIDGDGLLKVLGAEPRELETCGTAGALEDGALGPQAQVDLLSVGAIEVSLSDQHHSLAPRLFPALATTAAGWHYAGAAELPGPASAGDEPFVLSAAGQAGLGKFELRGSTPKEVHGLASGGVPVQAGSLLSRADNLEFTWEPGSADRIELEIFAGGSTLSCAARDDGHFRISRAQLRVLDADESAALIVRRVRTVPLEMAGVESAYARLAVTRSVSLRVE